MSDTITVYEKCDHNRLEAHPIEPYLPYLGGQWDNRCPGGKEIRLKWRQRYWHEGTGENGDISTWFVPVTKDEVVWIGGGRQ